MAVSEEFQLRPLYEDLFYRYYRLATHADEGEKMSAGELYLSLRKKSGMKLPQSKNFLFWKVSEKGGGTDIQFQTWHVVSCSGKMKAS